VFFFDNNIVLRINKDFFDKKDTANVFNSKSSLLNPNIYMNDKGTIYVKSCDKIIMKAGKKYKIDSGAKITNLYIEEGTKFLAPVKNWYAKNVYCYDKQIFTKLLEFYYSIDNFIIPEKFLSIYIRWLNIREGYSISSIERLNKITIIAETKTLAGFDKVRNILPKLHFYSTKEYNSLLKFEKQYNQHIFRDKFIYKVDDKFVFNLFKEFNNASYNKLFNIFKSDNIITEFLRHVGIYDMFILTWFKREYGGYNGIFGKDEYNYILKTINDIRTNKLSDNCGLNSLDEKISLFLAILKKYDLQISVKGNDGFFINVDNLLRKNGETLYVLFYHIIYNDRKNKSYIDELDVLLEAIVTYNGCILARHDDKIHSIQIDSRGMSTELDSSFLEYYKSFKQICKGSLLCY
jgi:hypothetical protein